MGSDHAEDTESYIAFKHKNSFTCKKIVISYRAS